MSTMMNLYSEFDSLRFRVQDDNVGDEQTIWINASSGDRVSLDLSRADRAKLRSALDEADAIADKT